MTNFFPSIIASSAAGHDKGVLYHVRSVEGDYAMLVDGKVRRIGNPKRKKLKHLRPMGESTSPCAMKLAAGEPVTNREVIESLAAYRAGRAFAEGGK